MPSNLVINPIKSTTNLPKNQFSGDFLISRAFFENQNFVIDLGQLIIFDTSLYLVDRIETFQKQLEFESSTGQKSIVVVPPTGISWTNETLGILEITDPLTNGLNDTRLTVRLTALYLKDTQTKSGCFDEQDTADYAKYGLIDIVFPLKIIITKECVQYTVTQKLTKAYDKVDGIVTGLFISDSFGSLGLESVSFDVSDGFINGAQTCVSQAQVFYQIVANEQGDPLDSNTDDGILYLLGATE